MTETTTPLPATVVTTATPPAQVEPPEVIALRAAEEARVKFEAALAATQAKAAEKQRETETETDRLKREVEELKARAAAIETIAKTHERDVSDARLAALRRMGLSDSLSDANALALAPRVDPRDAAGLVALEQWRQSNSGLFRSQGPTQAQVLEKLTPAIDRLPKSALFSTDKLIGRLYGGTKK
jgi:hypothetical protein